MLFLSNKYTLTQQINHNLVLHICITGLNHEQNLKKMRLLSFMQMAETNPDISFDDIISELQIEEKDVEAFIIEGIYCKYYYDQCLKAAIHYCILVPETKFI